jgi:hypothetical protein
LLPAADFLNTAELLPLPGTYPKGFPSDDDPPEKTAVSTHGDAVRPPCLETRCRVSPAPPPPATYNTLGELSELKKLTGLWIGDRLVLESTSLHHAPVDAHPTPA